jgi:hypothetical protein
MLADLYRSIVSTLTDPTMDTGIRIFLVIALMVFAGFVWMMAKRAWGLAVTPFRWWTERAAWKSMASAAGWTTPDTRKLNGEQDGRPWRTRVHVAGAWISDIDARVDGNQPTQAQWQMRDLPWTGHVLLLERAVDDELRRKAEAAASAGGATDVALAAAGLAGMLLGQGWAGAALDAAGALASSQESQTTLDVVPAGSDAFQSRFVLRSDNPALARSLITPEVESLIERLHDEADPADPLWARYAGGVLSLRHLGDFRMTSRVEPFCRLGLALAKAGSSAGA